MQTDSKRLLVFNCHEAWVWQLNALDYDLDIICGLQGRYTSGWDTHIRPVPARGRLISLDEARAGSQRYACIIVHNPTDLLDIKNRPEPRLLVHHMSMTARIFDEQPRMTAQEAARLLRQYARLSATHVVAVSDLKAKSWGGADDIVPFAVDPDDYPPCSGELACGLRVANFVRQRKTILHWSLHEGAFSDLPVRIVGHNADMAGVMPSRNWDHLKDLLRTHRFYIHTAHPCLEDGYNMATVEAMAAGLPVLGNPHPSSTVEHGVSGFLSDDPDQLRHYAQLLLADRELALHMGRQARAAARERFSVATFRTNMERAIRAAQSRRAALQARLQQGRTKPRIVEVPQRTPKTKTTETSLHEPLPGDA